MAIPQDTETTLVHEAEVIWYPQERGTDDLSDQYVMNVLGVRVMVRVRKRAAEPGESEATWQQVQDSSGGGETYVHIETAEGAVIEVNGGGEHEYS